MGMTEAAAVPGSPELQEKSLQTFAEAEGDTLGFAAVRSTESYSMASASDGELESWRRYLFRILSLLLVRILRLPRVSATGSAKVAFSGALQITWIGVAR
eukprot:4569998-Pyramimonas_sp.AAC.2